MQQQSAGHVVPELTDEGIVGFYAEHTASQDYQGQKFGIHYRFSQPTSYVDAVATFAEVQGQAEEQAKAALQQTLAQQSAQVAAVTVGPDTRHSEVPTVPPAAPHPAASSGDVAAALVEQELGGVQQPGGVPVAVGATPKGAQLRYVPSTHLSEQALRQAIEQAIRSHGFDPDHFAVFDNRITRPGSPYAGLEDGGKAYQVVTVRARNETAWQAVIGDKTQAFYVDFDAAGQLQVKPSDKLTQARAAQAAFAGGGA